MCVRGYVCVCVCDAVRTCESIYLFYVHAYVRVSARDFIEIVMVCTYFNSVLDYTHACTHAHAPLLLSRTYIHTHTYTHKH